MTLAGKNVIVNNYKGFLSIPLGNKTYNLANKIIQNVHTSTYSVIYVLYQMGV